MKKEEIEIKKCLNCGEDIQILNLTQSEYKRRKFCCQSCSAIYNNKKRKRNLEEKETYCLNCGSPLKQSQTKYCQIKCQHEHQQKEWEEKWFSGEISGFSETDNWGNVPDRIRTYLFKKFDSKCSKCGWGEVNPFTGRVPLEVEHIDGDYTNNRPENVTLLCPNCHSLTETYRGANKGKGRKKTWTPIVVAESIDVSS